MTADVGAQRVVLLAERSEVVALVRGVLLTAFPRLLFESSAPGTLRTPPTADCAIIVQEETPLGGIDALRTMRAQGFCGGAVLLAEAETTDVLEQGRVLGLTERVLARDVVRMLPAAVAEALAGAQASNDMSERWQELRRLQQLVAAGQVALGLRHALNNPLSALLAEAQLLEMEPLGEEYLEAVRRILELCRRLITIVRRLEGVSDPGQRG